MLAMDRCPFLGDLAGRDPQPEAEKVTRDRMQVERAMRLAAMQKNRHAGNRDMGDDKGEDEDLPRACSGQAVRQEVDCRVKYCVQLQLRSGVLAIARNGQ